MLLFVILTGCSAVPIEGMLAPPKLSEEQNKIYKALTDAVSGNINLHYPRTGENRSAFTVADIDGDGDAEAIVFYIAGEERDMAAEGAPAESALRINILDKKDGKWRSVCDYPGRGLGVDTVIISDLGGKKPYITVGYGLLSNEKEFITYSYAGERLDRILTGGYSSIFAADMNLSGKKDLVIIRGSSEYSKAHISLAAEKNGSVTEFVSADLNPDSTAFANIASGRVGASTPAIYIDSSIGGNLVCTEIIYLTNDEALRNPLLMSESEMILETARPSEYLSMDIDLDGVIEIPTVSLMPGYSYEDEAPLYFTDWNTYENHSIIKKYSSFYSARLGFCFIIPNRWEHIVTAETDGEELVFYNIAGGKAEIMRITAVSSDNVQQKIESGYRLVKAMPETSYLIKNSDDPLILTDTEINNSFYIIA